MLLFVALLFWSAGCKSFQAKQNATKKEATPIETAATKTDEATKKADTAAETVTQKTQERDSKLKANIDHAREKNQENPEGTPRTVVDGDLSVAQSYLQNVASDPAERAARERDAKLVESGKAAEARANYANAAASASKLTEELTKARLDAAQALAERDAARAAEATARADFVKQLEANKRAAQNAIDQARNEERQKLYTKITWGLTLAGIACILVGAFSAYTSVQAGDLFKAATRAGVWVFFGFVFIAAAWTINQEWFKWIVIGGLSAGVIAIAVMVRINWRDAAEKKSAKARTREADEAEDTLVHIMDALEAKLPPTHEVFQQLKGAMSDNHKALIHELRAERKRTQLSNLHASTT